MGSILRSALSLLVCTVAVTVSAGAAQQPAIDKSWRQIVTPDFIVTGTVPAGQLKRTLTELRRFRNSLARLFPESIVTSSVPTRVVVFRDYREFRRFQPRDSQGKPQANVGGMFSRRPDANIIVLCAEVEESALETIFHEYTHYVVSRNVRVPVPMWLNEGLAEFYSTFRGDFRGRTMIGKVPQSHATLLQESTYVPLRDILSPRDLESIWRWPTQIGMFYAESWALVHYVTVERKNPTANPLGTYLTSLARTGNHDNAFQEAFGTDVDGMDRELRQYVRRVSVPTITYDVLAEKETPSDARPMLEADVNALKGRLLMELGVHDEAERELTTVLKQQPPHAAAQIALARLRLTQEREDEAIAMLQQVVAGNPADGPAQYYLGTALERAWRHEEALAAFAKAIDLMPGNTSPWSGVNAAALGLKREAQAAAAVQNALQVDFSPSLYWTQALHALRLGRDDVAAESLARYLRLRGTGEDLSVYPLFVRALAAWRAGRPTEAEAALATAEQGDTGREWTQSVLRFLQGRLDEATLLRAADSIGEQTEARTYVGFKLAIAGRDEEALTHFRWVADHGAKHYLEYELAKNELNRLKYINRTSPVR